MASLQRRRRQGAVTPDAISGSTKLELSGRRPVFSLGVLVPAGSAAGIIFWRVFNIDTREKCLTTSRGQAISD